VLVIGVDDKDKSQPPKLTPVDLHGLRERIDQVARDHPAPPLHVRIETIPATADRTKGYLFVVVPPCPDGPRMVDGRYFGRNDTVKYVLPAEEVARHYERVTREQRAAEDLLDEQIARDPIGGSHAHLFGVAQPVLAQPDLLQRVVGATGDEGWHRFIHEQVRGPVAGRPLTPTWAPDLPNSSEVTRRADGWALSSLRMAGRKVEQTRPDVDLVDLGRLAVDLEINEDGGLRLFYGRASAALSDSSDEKREFVMDTPIVGITKRLILVANVVADTTGFLGGWDFGVAVTNFRGRTSFRLGQAHQDYAAVPYSKDHYRHTVRVTYERLMKDPDGIVEELVGQLGRGLGCPITIPQ
jgi:hypothetical protein